MFKKILLPIAILGMLFFTQCTDVPITPNSDNSSSVLKAGKGKGSGGGNGEGSKDKGRGGLNDHNGAGSGVYGDLIICLRNVDGVPFYEAIPAEKGDYSYYAYPLKINAVTLFPLRLVPFEAPYYATFELDSIGVPIPEDGYIVKEVDFGRTSVVRAPQSVTDHALDEAIAILTQPGVNDIKTDASGRLIAIIGAEDWLVNYDNDVTNDEADDKVIDSPTEDIALYQELMSNGFNGRLGFLRNYFSEDQVLTLACGALVGSADKTGNINVDQIAYTNDFIIKWEGGLNISQAAGSPDGKGRHYFNYSNFNYCRDSVYHDKYVRITQLNPNGTYSKRYISLLNAVTWTNPLLLPDYSKGKNTNITGFANAADDAVQVLEFIHSSDLIIYSPYFTSNGYGPPPFD